MYLFTLPYFNVFLVTMSFVAVIVFVSLYLWMRAMVLCLIRNGAFL